MALFPGALPVAGTADSTATLAAAGHTSLHNTDRDEIRAIAIKLGTGASTTAAGLVLRGTGAGTSAWGAVSLTTDVTGVLPVASGGTGVSTSTGSGSVALATSPTLNTPNVSAPVISGGGSWSGSPSLATPIISDFTNAQHTHAGPTTGGQISTTGIVDDAITDAKLIYGKLRSRQGGSASNWQTTGANTYDYSATNTFIQVGSIAADASPKSISFPTTFSQNPIVFAIATSAVGANCFCHVGSISTTGFNVQVVTDGGAGNNSQTVNWIAIGE